jgi:hypothetical protein
MLPDFHQPGNKIFMILETTCNIQPGGDECNVQLEVEMIAPDMEEYKRASRLPRLTRDEASDTLEFLFCEGDFY